jgi:SAM-dependent methyltransferase
MSQVQKYSFLYPRETWEEAAKTDSVFGSICHGWDKHRFETDPQSVFFSVACPPDAIAVDLGCGIGRVARWVAPRVGRYIGVDYAAAMVARARQYNASIPNATFILSDTLGILPDESADVIFSEQVFIHCTREQQLRYLGEAYDVLRPGGLLLASVPHVEHYVNGFDPVELAGLLVKYRVSTTLAGLGFVLRASKPQG